MDSPASVYGSKLGKGESCAPQGISGCVLPHKSQDSRFQIWIGYKRDKLPLCEETFDSKEEGEAVLDAFWKDDRAVARFRRQADETLKRRAAIKAGKTKADISISNENIIPPAANGATTSMAALNPLAVKDQNRSDILAGTKQTKTSTTSCTMETTGTEVAEPQPSSSGAAVCPSTVNIKDGPSTKVMAQAIDKASLSGPHGCSILKALLTSKSPVAASSTTSPSGSDSFSDWGLDMSDLGFDFLHNIGLGMSDLDTLCELGVDLFGLGPDSGDLFKPGKKTSRKEQLRKKLVKEAERQQEFMYAGQDYTRTKEFVKILDLNAAQQRTLEQKCRVVEVSAGIFLPVVLLSCIVASYGSHSTPEEAYGALGKLVKSDGGIIAFTQQVYLGQATVLFTADLELQADSLYDKYWPRDDGTEEDLCGVIGKEDALCALASLVENANSLADLKKLACIEMGDIKGKTECKA